MEVSVVFMKFLTKILIVVLALLLAEYVIPGIEVESLYVAVIVALLLGLINLIVRPILVILTLPITLLTLGLFIFIINALLFWFVASFVDGFYVAGFVPALLGAIFVSIISSVGNRLIS